MLDWRNLESFPISAAPGRAVRRGRKGQIHTDQATIDAAIAAATPYSPLLVSPGVGERFMPLFCVPELGLTVYANMKMRIRLMLIVLLVGVLAYSALWLWQHNELVTTVTVGVWTIAGYLALDYFLVLRHFAATRERGMFAAHLFDAGRFDAAFWLGFMLLAASIQLLGQQYFAGFDPFVTRFGAVYLAIRDGEWWRIAIGPLFHGSVSHWLVNATMLLLAGVLAGVFSRRLGIAVFFIACAAGVLAATYRPNNGLTDSFVGVSAGIFALFGMCFVAGLRFARHLPTGFAWTIGALTAANLLIGFISSPTTSNTAHITGLLIGCIAGGWLLPPPQDNIPESA
jgi:membrane associated rhomboid family serine protease